MGEGVAVMKKINLSKGLQYLPLLAPLPEGYAVTLAILREMRDWHPVFAVLSGLIVAGTGFYGVQVMNRMAEFNATLFQDEIKLKMRVPTWKAGIILAVWFTGVVGLTVFLDTVPILTILTPVGIVVVGFSASFLFSLSNILSTHEQERDKYRVTISNQKEIARNEKKQARQKEQAEAQERAKIKQALTSKLSMVQDAQGHRSAHKKEKLPRELLLMEWAQNPYLTPTEMVDVLWKEGKGVKVTREAIRQKREKLIKEGIISLGPDGAVNLLLSSSAADVEAA